MSLSSSAMAVQVPDGQTSIELAVVRRAASRASGGRRMLLLHGNPSHVDHWTTMVPALAQLGHVVAYDAPGFGKSARPAPGRTSLERSARIALAVCDAVGWNGAVDVVGQSHGGMIALAMASMAPSRVARLVLLGSGGTPAHRAYRWLATPGVGPCLMALGTAVLRAPLPRTVLRRVVRAAGRAAFSPDPMPAGFAEDELRLFAARPSVFLDMARLASGNPCARVAQHAALVKAPVLMLHGEQDALVPVAYARRLFDIVHASSPSSRFVAVPGGHMVHLTRPAGVIQEVDAWLSG